LKFEVENKNIHQLHNLYSHRVQIIPVSDGTHRPLWSVMIPTYNCASYLRETLASVLAQDPGSDTMQIEVIDDRSTKDNPEAVVRELGGDRVGFYQQQDRVGYIKNLETCLQRSRGKLVHLLHGDDCVRDDFYHKLQRGFDKNPEIGAAFCRYIYMDERGHWLGFSNLEQPESGILSNWLERIAMVRRIQTPSIVVRRSVYEHLGGFDRRMSCWSENWEMWVRIATCYPVWYETEPLALYRCNSSSLRESHTYTGENGQEFRKAIHIVQEYLPEYLPVERSKKLKQTALINYALNALRTAKLLVTKGNYHAAINQTREAFLCVLAVVI